MYAWDNCTRNTFERAREAVNGLIRNIVVHALLGTLAGWHGYKSYNRSNKIEIVKAQDAALKAADKVMDNNQLFDTDGSDAMVDYLNKASVVDSLNKLEQ